MSHIRGTTARTFSLNIKMFQTHHVPFPLCCKPNRKFKYFKSVPEKKINELKYNLPSNLNNINEESELLKLNCIDKQSFVMSNFLRG